MQMIRCSTSLFAVSFSSAVPIVTCARSPEILAEMFAETSRRAGRHPLGAQRRQSGRGIDPSGRRGMSGMNAAGSRAWKGLFWNSAASLRTSRGHVAVYISDWYPRGTLLMMRRICGSKPMSSIRSASSMTT